MPTPEAEIAKAVAENGPFALSNLVPTMWMAAIAAAGGYVNFRQKMKAGNVRAWNFTEFVGELVISSIAGVITFWICKGFGVNEWLTAAGVAISGHMGARLFFLAEKTAEELAAKVKDRV